MTVHTVVVGAGVSGLSTAFALLRRGGAVTVLERGEAGRESSWAGGGILSPLLPWEYAEPVNALALDAMATYADWVGQIESVSGLATEYWRCGMLALDVTRADEALAWCAGHGLQAHRQGAGMTADVWLPGVAQVRNPRLVAALRTAVTRLGGSVRTHCAARAVRHRSGRVAAVDAACGEVAADRVVLATGAWSGLGLAGLAGTPGTRPVRGQMLLFRAEPGALDRILYRDGRYLIPRRDGHILAGSTLEDAGFDKSTDEATRRRLHDDAARLLPALAGMQPVLHWAGLRPGSPENVPLIDRHPDFENVFVNTGHYRYGVTMAPAASELLADLVEGRAPRLDPAPYSWEAARARRWNDR